MPTQIHLHAVKINSLNASSFHTGSAEIIRRAVVVNKNQGFGQNNSCGSVFAVPVSSVNDCDVSDANSIKINPGS
ncbi:hypothetical protein TH62_03890 [Bacillus sp. TH008]|nr:hypothetical protein TH62_03890 [Bacillus sp. TH008]